MNKVRKKPSIAKLKKNAKAKELVVVRGSGFTYDEAKHHTDKSQLTNSAHNEDIVNLPNLGKPNRP